MTVPTTGAGQASRAYLRETVLHALEALLAERPWAEITMTDIAAAADVSRQTLYNEFGNRQAFVTAYLLWTAHQFLDEVERVVAAHHDDLRAAVTAAFELILTYAGSNVFIRALEGSSGAEGVLALAAPEAGRLMVELTTERLDDIIRTSRPDLPAQPVADLSEVLVRLGLSHIVMGTGSPTEAAAQVSAVLGPYLDGLEAGRQPAKTANLQDRKKASTSA